VLIVNVLIVLEYITIVPRESSQKGHQKTFQVPFDFCSKPGTVLRSFSHTFFVTVLFKFQRAHHYCLPVIQLHYDCYLQKSLNFRLRPHHLTRALSSQVMSDHR
jgi:hypothetical protein